MLAEIFVHDTYIQATPAVWVAAGVAAASVLGAILFLVAYFLAIRRR